MQQDPRHHFWYQAIKKEFESICYNHRVELKWPIFSIVSHEKSFWGKWDGTYETLSLHQQLFESYQWEVIREILKHEMAHMLVFYSEKMDSSSHGPLFLQFCAQLGMEPWAKKASLDLESLEPLKNNYLSSENENDSLRKARKLLALAGSSNEHEARLALERATKIMREHAISSWEMLEENQFSKAILRIGKKRTEAFIHEILHILRAYFNVEVILVDSFDPKSCNPIKTAEIIGRIESLRFAEYVFHFLKGTLERLWLKHQKTTGLKGKRNKNSYFHGVLERIGSNLKASSNQGEKSIETDTYRATHKKSQKVENRSYRSLIMKEKEELKAAFDYFFPKFSSTYRKRTYDRLAFEAGQKAGNQVSINRPIASSANSTIYLNS